MIHMLALGMFGILLIRGTTVFQTINVYAHTTTAQNISNCFGVIISNLEQNKIFGSFMDSRQTTRNSQIQLRT